MVSKHELEQLRAEAAKRQRDVTRKISRLKHQGGAPISGTGLDPRREPAKLKTYNSRQLAAYVRKLDSFMDRGTQYVGLGSGDVIPKRDWEKYKKLERQYNNRVNKNFESIKDKKLPNGRTIEEFMKLSTPDRRSARGVAVNAPYDPPVRVPQGVKNKKQLNKLIADMRKRVRTTHEEKQIKIAQSVFHQMSNKFSNAELDQKVSKLTPGQFRALWNYSTFAMDISFSYEQAKKMLTSDEDSLDDEFDKRLESANELAEWASKLKL